MSTKYVMKTPAFSAAALIAFLIFALSAAGCKEGAGKKAAQKSIFPDLPSFTLTSKDVKDGSKFKKRFIADVFGCKGGNKSPQLEWSGAPEGTKSYAVTMYDPDAPTGSGWWHWVVTNIPAKTTKLPTGAGNKDGNKLPKGAQQFVTDFGAPGYGGPCPPKGHGVHRYTINVFALKKKKLKLPETASPALVGFNLYGNALAKASMTVTYERK